MEAALRALLTERPHTEFVGNNIDNTIGSDVPRVDLAACAAWATHAARRARVAMNTFNTAKQDTTIQVHYNNKRRKKKKKELFDKF